MAVLFCSLCLLSVMTLRVNSDYFFSISFRFDAHARARPRKNLAVRDAIEIVEWYHRDVEYYVYRTDHEVRWEVMSIGDNHGGDTFGQRDLSKGTHTNKDIWIMGGDNMEMCRAW